jgi:hypothetical protein
MFLKYFGQLPKSALGLKHHANYLLFCCASEDAGIQVQLNLEGIDAWMRNKFNELGVDWKILRPGIYGIAEQNRKTTHLVEDDQDVFLFHYKSLFITPLYSQFTQQPKNVIVQFSDIFCEKVDLPRLIRTVATGKDVEFVLEWKNETLYLNGQRILTRFPTRQKAIMQVLIEEQSSHKYVSWDEIAARIEKRVD